MKKQERKDRVRYWLPVILWALVIFVFSSCPTRSASEIHWKDFVVKKTAHMVEYGILCLATYRALISEGIKRRKAGSYSIIFSILYGFTDEYHQSFTPGRMPRSYDVLFDTIGAVFAIYFVWKLLPRYQKSNKVFSVIYNFVYGEGKKEKTV